MVKAMEIADLHIHSRYSRATSADCDAPHLDLWARYKGISLVGTGDFTHPKWREELTRMLRPAEEGLYTLREEYALPCRVPGARTPRFVLSGEISTIYKRDGKTRKVHHVILLPGLEAAEELAHRLEARGNLHSDGRPILGLDSRELLDIVLESCPEAIYVPAHIWTPHFSLFGAFSGFDSIEECYGDLAPYVHALETGLSSDPPMNRRLSQLDGHPLISNSDAHSPAKLGREGNLLSCALSYPALRAALNTGEGLCGTLEFFPEEGKYHLDGHRTCDCRLTPEETRRLGGRCPVCGKKITIGVLHRVEELADRAESPLEKPFESLMPLPELIGDALGVSAASKKAQAVYFDLLEKLGNEFFILRECPPERIEAAGDRLVAEGLRRLRAGRARRLPGYDGVFGAISLFGPGEREALSGQTTLLSPLTGLAEPAPCSPVAAGQAAHPSDPLPAAPSAGLNPEQQAAVEAENPTVAVIAGPGTGKTGTLIARIAYLIEEKGVKPGEITAITFTRQAAGEMKARLEKRLGVKGCKGLTVGTFHAVCLQLIEKKPLISRPRALEILAGILRERGEKLSPAQALALISRQKNGLPAPELSVGAAEAYRAALDALGARDLDDVLLEALKAPAAGKRMFHHLLVDEFQDLNAVQRQLTRHFSRLGTLFVIGDPDQSIYGFRGADAACFDALLSDRPDAAVIRLTRNYRSTPEIVDCALKAIEKNAGQRALVPHRPAGAPVRLVTAADGLSEGAWIAREIVRMTGGLDMLSARPADSGETRAFSEMAVLARTRRQLEKIEKCLRQEDIPCALFGRGDFLEDENARGLLGFFSALLSPEDLPALSLALKTLWHCPAGLSQRAEAAWAESSEPGALQAALAPYDGLTPFVEAIAAFTPKARKEKPRRLLAELAQMTGVVGKPLEELLDTAVFQPDMAAFLAALALGEEADLCRLSGGKPSGAVRLMTLHAAKGLEFPVVFLSGVTEGALPLERAGEIPDFAQERRLFFVGITRARDELILTCGGAPSPFLLDLPGAVERSAAQSRAASARGRQLCMF